MSLHDLVPGIGVGLIGGFTSGLLGVSPGGALVVFSVFLLGAEQHVAQGISLIAQIPPTSVSAIKRYVAKGSRSPLRWLLWLTFGLVAGGALGAYAASFASNVVLRWTYVGYLAGLDVMLIARGARTAADQDNSATPRLHWAALLAVGLFAGVSSGFIGIGGGLATVVGLHAVLGVPQHRAQMISLVLSLVPTTIPSAWIYWNHGWSGSWLALAGVIGGLVVGNDVGARLANKIGSAALYATLIVFVSIMTAYMIYKALT